MATANIFGFTDTWNNGATTFSAIKVDVTNTASAAASTLLDLQIGSVSKFSVRKDGAVTMSDPLGVGGNFQLLASPNGLGGIPVPTLYPTANNQMIAFDVSCKGTPTDLGYGVCWVDLSTTDQITSGSSPTQSLHFSAGTNPSQLFIASTIYSGGSYLPLKFGTFDGDALTYIYTFQINTDASLTVFQPMTVDTIAVGTFLSGVEQTAPSAPAANGYRLYAEDNGGGKTRLMVLFSSGAAQQIAIQP